MSKYFVNDGQKPESSLPRGPKLFPQVPHPAIDYMAWKSYEFKPPPECPVYYPTAEEFSLGPIEYINRIRETAESYGIIKIIPPKEFQMPFVIDKNEFRFSPRTQRINDLEAVSRLRLNFTDKLDKFWSYQGVSFRTPIIDKKYLDVYNLHTCVEKEGGFELCCRNKKWATIAIKMGYNKNCASQLRNYYEKFLFPYDIFLSGATTHPEITNESGPSGSKRKSDAKEECNELCLPPKKFCYMCGLNSQPSSLLSCENCGKSFHKLCLIPNFTETPKTAWNCHSCLASILQDLPKVYSKDFGFTQSYSAYTLEEFGKTANTFKENYFKAAPGELSCADVEKEFWRILTDPFEHIVCVEYGADLHTNDYGSGFPTEKNISNLNDEQKKYINSLWNLNVLPTSNGSVFQHINTEITGMIIPWMYVGMCFSAFCWHNEDHWTYSINYLHWGEPKTWYGIPGDKADIFEDAMREIAPDLFNITPDLLHHLITTCNPNLLMEKNVPIYRTDQRAGEFVVTFPRSYHAGFNQGFNFAEAVNFATADWLPLGRLSMKNYSKFKRFPVFSHDELICKMTDANKNLNQKLAIATYEHFTEMIHEELVFRNVLFSLGIMQTEYYVFESVKDDERSCVYCKTTCFLSAIKCSCKKNKKLACGPHYNKVCRTCTNDDLILLFRYRMDELRMMELELLNHINTFNKVN